MEKRAPTSAITIGDRPRSPNPGIVSYFGESLLPTSLGPNPQLTDQLQQKFPVRFEYIDLITNPDPEFSLNNQTHINRLKNKLHILNGLDAYVDAHNQEGARKILKDRQLNVFEDIHNFLEAGNTEGYIKAPPGFGKTVLFTELAAATDVPTLIVVPTKLLVEQTYARMRKFHPELDIGRIYDKRKEWSAKIKIVTYDSFVAHTQSGNLKPEETEMLFLDEAHKSLTDKRVDTVANYQNAIKLGFTATPDYSVERRLINLLGTEIHAISIPEGVRDDYLSSFTAYLAETDTDLTQVTINASGDFDKEELTKAINIKSRNDAGVQILRQIEARDAIEHPDAGVLSTIAYCADINHAQEAATAFQQDGIAAAAIWGSQDPHEQAEILAKFEAGEIQVICNAKLLLEGYDFEKVRMIINMVPTLSPVTEEQRCGRGLRLDPDNPYKLTYIIDMIDKNRQGVYPITFPEIVESARLLNRSYRQHRGETGEPKEPLDIAGVRVTVASEEVMRLTKEHVATRTTAPPEGWMTANGLETITDLPPARIRNIITSLLEEHPEYAGIFGTIKSAHRYFSPEVANEILKITAEGPKRAPTDWINLNSAKERYKVNKSIMRKLLEDYLIEHPDAIQEFYSKLGNVVSFVSPDAIPALERALETYNAPPMEGWVSEAETSENLGVSRFVLRKIAKEQFGEELPIKIYKTEEGKFAAYYSPEIAAFVAAEVPNRYPTAPEGWVLGGAVAKETGIDIRTVAKYASQTFGEETGVSGAYTSPTEGKVRTFYSPEAASRLRTVLDRLPKTEAPEGWVTKNNAITKLGISRNLADELLESYLAEHPDEKGRFIVHGGRGNPGEHLSADAIAHLTTAVENLPIPPEGWSNADRVSREFGVDYAWVQRVAAELAGEDMSQMGIFRSKTHPASKFYAPELKMKIKERALSRAPLAPPGWLTPEQAAKTLGRHVKTIKQQATAYTEAIPELTGSFRVQGSDYLHYSPELITFLKNEIDQTPRPPEGWQTPRAFAFDKGFATAKPIKKRAEAYLLEHPEWVHEFRGVGGQTNEFYSPELIAVLENELNPTT